MTVGELITELQKLDPNLLIIVHDPEDYPAEPTIIEQYQPYQRAYWKQDGKIGVIANNTPYIEVV